MNLIMFCGVILLFCGILLLSKSLQTLKRGSNE